ncbi:unnamed protein product, partial [Symbiodinium sp. KB8]
AGCYECLGQPLRAAERLSASNEAEHLKQAAALYRDHEEPRVFERQRMMDDLPDRQHIIENCIVLYDRFLDGNKYRLEEWGKAAALLEELATVDELMAGDSLLEAVRYFAMVLPRDFVAPDPEVDQPMDQARVYEKMANLGPIENLFDADAAELYSDAKALKDRLRVSEGLREFKVCGDLARELKENERAARFYEKAETEDSLQLAMECMIEAKDFESAYRYFSPEIVEMEITCLEGLGRFDAAARRVMATLPVINDNISGQRRQERALRGFKLASQDDEKRKQFFADFSDEMPDEEAALVYWAELGENTLHLFELFLQCGKPVAAVAAASELGRPEEALQLLHKCQVSWEDWHCYTLDILMTAVQQKKLSDNQARGLGKASRTLRSSLPEGALQARVRLDYVDAVLRRLGGDGGREKLALRSSYTSVEVAPELNLCFGEELAFAECAQVADATWTLQQLEWYINEARPGAQRMHKRDD